MPQIQNDFLPGKKGTDFHYVKYGDRVYVVYRVKLPNGKYVNMSWRIEQKDQKALGVEPGRIQSIGGAAFRALNFFGDASELAMGGKDVHPFQQYLSKLRELHGSVSWMQDKEFMSVMLMGFAENWTAAELQQRLTRTKWYKGRTDQQRTWELETNPAQRKSQINTWGARLTDALDDIYGPGVSYKDSGIDPKQINQWAEQIASGKFGSPEDGFAVWMQGERNKASKIEGTTAWTERQQEVESQRAFMNRPEDVFEQIRSEAMQWLGPAGVPDRQTLRRWSEDLVSEKASDGDWQKFLRKQAVSLYPWLGPDERWEDRASSYKRIIEDELGTSVGFDHKLLGTIGGMDANGVPSGAALSYDDFARAVRSTDEWWSGSKAKEEGFDLFNELNNVFGGIQV